MADVFETAFADAEAAADSPISSMLNALAERLGARATVKAVFGEPVERDGVTVIPVARVRWGFGGGAGTGGESHAEGSEAGTGGGGGGGASASPVGYIEISGGRAEFRRIPDAAGKWPLILAGTLAAWVVLRGIRLLVRG